MSKEFVYQQYVRSTKKPGPVSKEERNNAAWSFSAIKEEAPDLIKRCVRRKWVGFHGVLGMDQ